MGWKVSTILQSVGTAAIVIGEEVAKLPGNELYGWGLAAIGVGCIAAGQYLAEKGFKLLLRR